MAAVEHVVADAGAFLRGAPLQVPRRGRRALPAGRALWGRSGRRERPGGQRWREPSPPRRAALWGPARATYRAPPRGALTAGPPRVGGGVRIPPSLSAPPLCRPRGGSVPARALQSLISPPAEAVPNRHPLLLLPFSEPFPSPVERFGGGATTSARGLIERQSELFHLSLDGARLSVRFFDWIASGAFIKIGITLPILQSSCTDVV